MPERPSAMACQASRQLLPSGQTVPMPVTTTRRFGRDVRPWARGRPRVGRWRDGCGVSGRVRRRRRSASSGGPARMRSRHCDSSKMSMILRVAVEALADVAEHVAGADLEERGRAGLAHLEERAHPVDRAGHLVAQLLAHLVAPVVRTRPVRLETIGRLRDRGTRCGRSSGAAPRAPRPSSGSGRARRSAAGRRGRAPSAIRWRGRARRACRR